MAGTIISKNMQSGAALAGAVAMWAATTTSAETDRGLDLVRDKTRAVTSFFEHVGSHPADVTPLDVREWIDKLENSGRAAATVYAMASRISSWYKWAMQDAKLAEVITHNPVTLARPKAPKAYRGSQALSDEAITALLAAVPRDTLTGRRDYAMLLFYLLTGHRRSEVCRLRWGDLERNGTLTIRFLVKGGDYESEEVSLVCWDALMDYLQASGRFDSMDADTPLWVGHDRAGQASGALSSHSFAKNLKRYARLAGIEKIHVHQLRHTVARMVGDNTGDLGAVQHVLGHKNLATTRVYLRTISVKRDTHSAGIAARLGL